MGQNQSDRQASIRAVTGTAWTYEGDWHALFDQAGIASGDYNGRLLAWINQSMGASYAELNGAMSAFAASQSAPSWNEMGTFTPGSAPVAAWDASTSTLAQLAVLATHTRTSLATMFDSTGKLTYAPNNLLLNTATLGTQTVTVQVGVNYILSIKGTGSVTLTGASTAGPLNGTGASNRVDLKITAATSSLTLTVSGSVTSARLSAVTYETAFRSQDDVDNTASAYYGPRIDYDPNTLAVKGLLIEEARTNLLIQSGNFSASWTALGAIRSTDGTLGPDGATAMAKYTADAATSSHELYTTAPVSFTAGSNYTASLFVKKGNYRYVFINMETSSTSGFLAVFDLDNPTAATQTWALGTGSYVGSKIENEGGGIYRIQITGAILSGTTAYVVAGFVAAATGNPTTSLEPSWTAAGTEYGYFFGGQLELGSFATSYIPTAAASVTRAADVVNGSPAGIGGAVGALFVEFTPLDVTAGRDIITLDVAGATNPSIGIYVASGALQTFAYNGSFQFNGTPGSPTANTVFRAGVSWNAGAYRGVMNGGTIQTASGAAISTTSRLDLGKALIAGGISNGWYKSFAVFNANLSNAQFQAKSVVGASY